MVMSVVDFLFTQPIGFQAFWVWLIIGGLILGLEVMVGTQWLLWPATAAGVVAVLTLTGLPVNLLVQIVVFSVLTLGLTLASKRFMKVEAQIADINDPNYRLIGKEAVVIEAFDDKDGHQSLGRVIYDGVEWPAIYERSGRSKPILLTEKVQIVNISEGKLLVKPA